MSSAAAMAARSAFRSTIARAPISARLSNGAKMKPAPSPFAIPKQNPLSQSLRILSYGWTPEGIFLLLLPNFSTN
ncbi:protein NUCLEAR FUSION DEFECTIVE 6 [Cucumis melo var. makuwa]|uniref:Protein NUCLEAR FUSION DEFECTIVE 6 n=1 Tax=Cucumis melo var. makuwa TaxID=1194695 RepID=A0A5D3CNM1_CUCMM|nr:protein NUCLEAR FUSION DEFECTIVE 6 [Cucumis melo var. makuwa]